MMQYLAVFIGGGIGSVTRFGIARAFASVPQLSFPLATLLSNIVSCILLGGVMFIAAERIPLPHHLKQMIAVGVCGGLSTFSTFSLETFELFRQGYMWLALLNIFLSVGVCLGILYLLYRQSL